MNQKRPKLTQAKPKFAIRWHSYFGEVLKLEGAFWIETDQAFWVP